MFYRSGLGIALGLDIQDVVKSVTSPSSLASSWMFQNRTSHLLSGDKSIHSALNIIVKDMVSYRSPSFPETIFVLEIVAQIQDRDNRVFQ